MSAGSPTAEIRAKTCCVIGPTRLPSCLTAAVVSSKNALSFTAIARTPERQDVFASRALEIDAYSPDGWPPLCAPSDRDDIVLTRGERLQEVGNHL